MLKYKHLQEELRDFGKKVVRLSRYNLTRGKHNVSGDLYKSIKSSLNEISRGFEVEVEMDQYGLYVDQGVHGTKSSYVTARNSPYKYKSTSGVIGLEYNTGIFAKWAKSKKIRLRDEKGKFQKGNYKSIGFILARSIKEKGIKPTMFMTKAFRTSYVGLDKKISQAIAKDIAEDIKQDNKNTK